MLALDMPCRRVTLRQAALPPSAIHQDIFLATSPVCQPVASVAFAATLNRRLADSAHAIAAALDTSRCCPCIELAKFHTRTIRNCHMTIKDYHMTI